MATFKCNHDVQVLLGGQEATHRIHYCCKYVTKQQKRLDSVVAIAMGALKRRQEREQLQPLPPVLGAQAKLDIARKRVASMMYNTTNRQEVAGPLAALYLHRGLSCYSSATCTSLPLGDIIRQLCTSGEYSCNLVKQCNAFGASTFQAVSALDDFIYRPEALKEVNLYEFTMRFFRKKDKNALEARFGFLIGHRLRRSHSLGQRFNEVVPVIRGYRLPYVDSDSSLEFQYKYAILSLVLFKPFRCLEDLVGEGILSDAAWLHAYTEWKETRSDFVKTIMNNMNDYHSGLNHAKAQHAEMEKTNHFAANAHGGADDDSEDGDDDDNLYGVDDEVDDLELEENTDTNDNVVDIWDADTDSSVVVESNSLNPAVCPSAASPDSRITHILDAFESCRMLQGVARDTALGATTERCSLPSAIDVRDMRKWIINGNTDNTLISSQPEQRDVRTTEVVELLDDTLTESNMRWSPVSMVRSQSPTGKVVQFASISAISRAFTLNKKQHCALKKIGIALVTRWKHSEGLEYSDSNVENALRADQLRLFLGGEGGTGKSRIIDAVQTLCISWRRSTALVKTALTGKAATLISGRTLESLLLQLKGGKSVGATMDIDALIIDEISMMKRVQLVQLDRRLRIAKRVPGVPFGGIHIVLVGDFLQLPPVGADPIYRDPSLKPRSTATDFAGFQLWRDFEDVILLEESVRFQEDPQWGRGCHDARLGIRKPEFVELINSRVITQDERPLMEWISGGGRTTFVTPDNSTRLSINNLFISKTASLLPKDVYPVRVVANFKGKLKGLNRTEVGMVMSLPDSKFGRMAPYLDLIAGMPIQITQNVRPQKMVANGTLRTLESIIYKPGTTFRVIHDTIADVLVKIPSTPPPAVIVRLPRGDTASPMLGSADTDLFPLFFESQAFKQCEIPLTRTANGIPRVLAVRIQQFPLVCATASTIYKVQGETLNRMVVTEWRSKTTAANKREQPYLLVSRVTSRLAFVTLSPLTPEIIQWAHPPADALEEEQRLQRLSDATIGSML